MKVDSFAKQSNDEVSHNKRILKRVILKNDQCGNITQLARSIFPPGEKAENHCHQDMIEVFMPRSGTGTITIDGKTFDLKKDACIIIELGEYHELKNTGKEDLVMDYFGLQV